MCASNARRHGHCREWPFRARIVRWRRAPSMIRAASFSDASRSRGEMSNVSFQPEERARSYKKLEEDAIALARESRWEEAAEKNRELLALYPDDVSGYNRLGKALSELGHYTEAREAYNNALEIDPNN